MALVTSPARPPAQARASIASRTVSPACSTATRRSPAHRRRLPRRPAAPVAGIGARF